MKILITEKQLKKVMDEIKFYPEDEERADYPEKTIRTYVKKPDWKKYYKMPETYRASVETLRESNDLIPQYVYVRFGLPNKNELGEYINSYCYYGGIEGPMEGGISVYEAEYKNGMYHVFTYGHRLNTSFDILMHSNRDLYLVDGEDNGNEGADGEILLDPCTFRVIKKIPKNKIIQER